MKKIYAIKATKYALMLLLILKFILSLIPLLVNPEAWFFGYKLGGIKASRWLLTNGIIGLVLAYSLLKNIRYSFLAAFIFFVVDFVNAMMIPVRTYHPLPFLGLILSLLGVVLEVRK